MEYSISESEYKPSTLEELSEYYNMGTPVILKEVPVNIHSEENYVNGFFEAEGRNVVFYAINSNPKDVRELTRIMESCSRRGIELKLKGKYYTNAAEFSTNETRERLDLFIINGIELGTLEGLRTR